MNNTNALLFAKGLLLVGAAGKLGYTIIKCDPASWFATRKHDFVSFVASATAETPADLPEFQRSQFTATPLILRKPIKDHTHGVSASLRSSASNFMEDFARNLALKPYFIQCSRADQRLGRAGSRSLFWAKDLTAKVSALNIPKDSISTLVDVDYYMDMPSFLINNFNTTLLYSFQPDEVSKIADEYSYTFNQNNEVTYTVTGGGQYTHKVWNYGTDHVLVAKKFLGFPYKVAAYLVDKRNVGPDHDLVLLTPLRRWTGIFAIFGYLLDGRELKRLAPAKGGFLRMKSQRSDGMYVSTGIPGAYARATIRSDYDDAIAIAVNTTKTHLQLPTVLSYIGDGELVDRKVAASALLAYHRGIAPVVNPQEAIVFPVESAVRNYDYGVRSFNPEAKTTLMAYMNPIIHGAFAPLQTASNEEACIEGRITKLVRKPGELTMTEFLNRVMNEFVDLFLPEKHMMEPTDLDEVYERQHRPTQRRILDASMPNEPDRIIKSFVKKEAYQEPKEPRPISTINGVDKRDYSTFIYPLADYIKTMDWYAFGKTPVKVAERVTQVLSDAATAVNTDFSRFDGRVSELLRDLERRILIAAFKSCYAYVISELHSSQFNQPAIGAMGTRYNTGYARASGSPETAAFNSIANAFVAYLTFRMTRICGGFISPQEAWRRLGIYGGDDGLTADVDPSLYTKASDLLGLKLDVELITRGCEGITFLSRKYGPHVWYGDANSCCDLPRQLTKFHTTVQLPPNVTPLEKLLEKARAFFLTDKNTPILGELVSKITSIHGSDIEMKDSTVRIRSWNSLFPKEVQYPNDDQGWMESYSEHSLGKFGFDFELFRKWLKSVTCLDDFLTPPLCAEPKEPELKATMVVDEDIKEPERKKAEVGKERQRTKTKRGRRDKTPRRAKSKS